MHQRHVLLQVRCACALAPCLILRGCCRRAAHRSAHRGRRGRPCPPPAGTLHLALAARSCRMPHPPAPGARNRRRLRPPPLLQARLQVGQLCAGGDGAAGRLGTPGGGARPAGGHGPAAGGAAGGGTGAPWGRGGAVRTLGPGLLSKCGRTSRKATCEPTETQSQPQRSPQRALPCRPAPHPSTRARPRSRPARSLSARRRAGAAAPLRRPPSACQTFWRGGRRGSHCRHPPTGGGPPLCGWMGGGDGVGDVWVDRWGVFVCLFGLTGGGDGVGCGIGMGVGGGSRNSRECGKVRCCHAAYRCCL